MEQSLKLFKDIDFSDGDEQFFDFDLANDGGDELIHAELSDALAGAEAAPTFEELHSTFPESFLSDHDFPASSSYPSSSFDDFHFQNQQPVTTTTQNSTYYPPPQQQPSFTNGTSQYQQNVVSQTSTTAAQSFSVTQSNSGGEKPLLVSQGPNGPALPLQMVNGQLVIQAQLQHVQTPNGLVAVAVLQPFQLQSVIQQQQQLAAQQRVIQQPISISTTTARASTSPAILPSANQSKSRPLKPKKPASKMVKCQQPKAPAPSNGKLSIQLDPESAKKVVQLNEQIDLLQQSGSDPMTIARLQKERNDILDSALQSQHGISASHVGSNGSVQRPAPVAQPMGMVLPAGSQPQIVSMNGQSYMMVPNIPQSQGGGVQHIRVEAPPQLQPQQQYSPMQNGNGFVGRPPQLPMQTQFLPPGSQFSSGNSQKQPTSSSHFRIQPKKLTAEEREAERKRRRERTLAQRRETLKQYKASDESLLKASADETPFSDLGDAIARLMPFHLNHEEDFASGFLDIVDRKQERINEELRRRKRSLEERFMSERLKESSVTNPAWEECLMINLLSWHESDLLKYEKRLASINPDKLLEELKPSKTTSDSFSQSPLKTPICSPSTSKQADESPYLSSPEKVPNDETIRSPKHQNSRTLDEPPPIKILELTTKETAGNLDTPPPIKLKIFQNKSSLHSISSQEAPTCSSQRPEKDVLRVKFQRDGGGTWVTNCEEEEERKRHKRKKKEKRREKERKRKKEERVPKLRIKLNGIAKHVQPPPEEEAKPVPFPPLGLEPEAEDDLSDEFLDSPKLLIATTPPPRERIQLRIKLPKKPSAPHFSPLDSEESENEGLTTTQLIQSALTRLETSEGLDLALKGLEEDSRKASSVSRKPLGWCGFNPGLDDEAFTSSEEDPEASAAVGGILSP